MFLRMELASAEYLGKVIDVSGISGTGNILVRYDVGSNTRSFVIGLRQLVNGVVNLIENEEAG